MAFSKAPEEEWEGNGTLQGLSCMPHFFFKTKIIFSQIFFLKNQDQNFFSKNVQWLKRRKKA